MQIIIYYREKPLYLCDQLDANLEELSKHPDTIYMDELSSPAINAMVHEIKKEDFHAGIFLYHDLYDLKKSFFKHFTLIEAAGGIVQNERKELLFIFRRGKWDLPKGKMEKNENAPQCAIREIEEETGINGLNLQNPIEETFHIYDEYGKHFLKVSHWFFFTCKNEQKLAPQLSEDITAAKWFKIKDIAAPLANTYATIKDVVAVFLQSQ